MSFIVRLQEHLKAFRYIMVDEEKLFSVPFDIALSQT